MERIDFKLNLTDETETLRELIENKLSEYMNKSGKPQQRVFDAMAYSLLAGGKRLRPVIMLLVCKMCGGNEISALPFACALEMIHTYSLIHDDLPAMDNDDLRRGRPTNHIKFDEATAILAGDALLNLAFEITSANTGAADKTALRAISILARASGADGMIGGQIIDIKSENKKLTLDELKYLHSLKTGALIRAAGACGAVLADADTAAIKSADEFCKNLGIAFQIRDDILDVTGDTKVLGKKTGSDAVNNKNTYVSLLSLEEAEKLCAEYTKKAKEALAPFGKAAAPLLTLADELVDRCN